MSTQIENELTGADAEYGYRYGCESLMSVKQAAKEIGVHRNSIIRFCNDGRLRAGKLPDADGVKHSNSKRVICVRSVREYIASTQD